MHGEKRNKKDHKLIRLKQASNKQKLRNWENILITKNKDRVINFEILPADPLTKYFISSYKKFKISRSWVDNEEQVPERASHMFK